MRIVVVGGGVIGLSTAFHLADRNAGQVILVEKGPIGDGSSSRAGGIITGLMGTETAVRARKISLELFHRFSREVDGYTFHDVGTLNLAEDQGAGRVEMLPLYDRLDAPYEILDADEMRRRWPLMAVPDDAWALYDPIAGYSEPDEYVAAMGAHLRNLGVEIREFEPVLEFPMQGDRVIGVRTTAATIEADVVVCASHVWSIRLLEQFGWRMPSKVFVHQRYVSTPVSKPVILPAVNDHPRHGYYRPAFGNRVLIGIETPDREEVPPPERDTHLSSFSVDPEIRERELNRLQYVVPGVAPLSWEIEKVGLLAYSADGEPILGPVPGVRGLICAGCFHSGGFAYNPAAGLLAAEWAVDGRTGIDISAFAPDRFDPQQAGVFIHSHIRHGDYQHGLHAGGRH